MFKSNVYFQSKYEFYKKTFCFLVLVIILSCKAQNNEKVNYYKDIELSELIIKNQSIFNIINNTKNDTNKVYKSIPYIIILSFQGDSTLRIETMYNFHSFYNSMYDFVGAFYMSDHTLVLLAGGKSNNEEQVKKFFSLKENKQIFKIPYGILMNECDYYYNFQLDEAFILDSKDCSIDMVAP